VKAAGGVKDLASAREMIAAGATRIGASAGVKIVRESQGVKTTGAPYSNY
jgi:deoxyribose-phosphate aldolase